MFHVVRNVGKKKKILHFNYVFRAQSTNNPFWVEEDDSTPPISRATKEKISGGSKKKVVKRDKKVSQKKKTLLSKNPFASETESDSDGQQIVARSAPKRKRNITASDSEVRYFFKRIKTFH